MHIILGVLSSIVTILWMLDRLGVDIGGMNPFYWYRRRAFARKYGSDPIYSIDDPIHVASLLVIGTAKLDGDLTAGQKNKAQGLFESEFSMNAKEASQLFGSAAHLLAAPQLLEQQLGKFADRNTNRFSPQQIHSLLGMMTAVAAVDGDMSTAQRAFIDKIRAGSPTEEKPEGTWA